MGNRTAEPGTILISGGTPFDGYADPDGRSYIGDGQHTEGAPPDWTVTP